MDFYRGDDRPYGDPTLAADGFTAKPPARTLSGTQARALLAQELANKQPGDLGMKWRLQTPGGLIATALTQDGAYQGLAFLYKISIPNHDVRLQEIGKDGRLGEVLSHEQALTTRKYFVLYDSGSYATATLLAFCHPVGGREATFLTAIPARYVVGFRSKGNTTKTDYPFATLPKPVMPPRG